MTDATLFVDVQYDPDQVEFEVIETNSSPNVVLHRSRLLSPNGYAVVDEVKKFMGLSYVSYTVTRLCFTGAASKQYAEEISRRTGLPYSVMGKVPMAMWSTKRAPEPVGVAAATAEKRCECGAAKLGAKTGAPGHSSWCPAKKL